MDDKTYRRSMTAVIAIGAAIAIGTVAGTASSFNQIAAHAKSAVTMTQPAGDDGSPSDDDADPGASEPLLGPHADTTGTQGATKQDAADGDAKAGTQGAENAATQGTDDNAPKADQAEPPSQTEQTAEPTATSGQASGQADAPVGAAGGSAKIQTYDVQWGDTLSGVSRSTGVSVENLARENGITDVDLIYAGSSLRVPQG